MFKRSPGHEHEHEARTHKKAETKPISLKKKKPHPKLQMDDVEIWVCRVIARAVLLQQVLPLICINLLL